MNPEIRRAGIRIRLLFWLVFIAASSFVPFSSLYYKQVFSSGTGGGAIELMILLLAIQPLLSIVSNPFAGYLADKFKIDNRMLAICSLFVAAGCLLMTVPGVVPELATGTKLILMGVGIVLLGLFAGPVFPIINAETLDHIHAQKLPASTYGRFRLHGSLSWIVFTIVIGAVLSLTRMLELVMVFYFAGYLCLALVALTGLRATIKPVRLPLTYLRKDWRFRRFIVFNMLQSFSLFGSLLYTGYFLNDSKIDYFLIGLAFAVGSVLELPVLLNARTITARFGSRALVIAGTFILTLKLILLGTAVSLKALWLILPVMLIHGIGFGTQVLGVMEIIDKLAHKDLRATYLNLYTTIGVNLPMAAGLLFSGWIIKVLDSTWMMLIDAGLASVSILYFIFFVKIPSRGLKNTGRSRRPESQATV